MLEFDIVLEWIPGKWNTIADLLSRHLSDKTVETQTEISINNVALNEEWLQELKTLLKQDDYARSIMNAIKKKDTSSLDKGLKAQIHQFDIEDDILFYEKQRV